MLKQVSSDRRNLDGEIDFTSFSDEYPEVGILEISERAIFLINDGQHRKTAYTSFDFLTLKRLYVSSILKYSLFVNQHLYFSSHIRNVPPSSGA